MAIGGRNIVWEWGVPRVIQGYWDLGPITIPPLPQYTVLTDRNDGVTLWLLQYNNDPVANPTPDGLGYISISNIIPKTPDKVIYGPYDGPWIATRIRLMVRNGYLGMDLSPKDPVSVAVTDAEGGGQILARQTGVPKSFRKIIRPSTYNENGSGTFLNPSLDLLGWVDFEVPPQTPNPVAPPFMFNQP